MTAFSDLVGRTLTGISGAKGDEEMVFTINDGARFRLIHHQDCCETVDIDDICGDIADLIGAPILQAEESSNSDDPPKEDYDESHTWTFYKLATIKGSVTIRWYGSSNGYYSEDVEFEEIKE